MENCFSEPSTITTTSLNPIIDDNLNNSQMGLSPSHFFSTQSQSFDSISQSHNQIIESNFYPFAFPSDYATPSIFPVFPSMVDQNGLDFGQPNSIIGDLFHEFSSNKHVGGDGLENSYFEEQKRRHSSITKAARSKRKIAMQKSFSSSTYKDSSGSTSLSFSSSSRSYSNKLAKSASATKNSISSSIKKEIFTFPTLDNKELELVLRKELKNSDVSSLGRVVLPKKDAEANLPRLIVKEGILIAVREVVSTKVWCMRYRFWPNNKSRMYVLENTGDFVKQNDLTTGDCIILYQDERKQLFINYKKAENPVSEPQKNGNEVDNGESFSPLKEEMKEEEAASITPPEKKLKEEEQKSQETVSLDGASSFGKSEEIGNCSFNNITDDTTSTQPAMVMAEPPSSKDEVMDGDILRADGSLVIDFDDCFSDLSMLPYFDDYNLFLYDDLMKDFANFRGDDTEDQMNPNDFGLVI